MMVRDARTGDLLGKKLPRGYTSGADKDGIDGMTFLDEHLIGKGRMHVLDTDEPSSP